MAMPPRTRAVLASAGLALCAVAGGCSDSPLPGSLLGTYQVVANLQATACGPGLAAATAARKCPRRAPVRTRSPGGFRSGRLDERDHPRAIERLVDAVVVDLGQELLDARAERSSGHEDHPRGHVRHFLEEPPIELHA